MNREPRPDVGLSGVAGVLPPQRAGIDDLARRGLLVSPPDALAKLGFKHVHLADQEHDLRWLVTEAARRALADARLDPEQIDVLIWSSALAQDHVLPPGRPRGQGDDPEGPLHLFRYPSGWLQDELRLDRAQVWGVAQQGCASMFAALSMAYNTIRAQPDKHHVLCVGVDVLPAATPREILYNVISDAACAVVVSRGHPADRWLAYHQVSKGYYWDTPVRQKEILAAYFPTARLTILELLERAGITPGDVDVIVPSGVQRGSWDILLDLVGIPGDRLRLPGESFGHSIVADNFLLLERLRRENSVARGSRLLLFTYGFGSSWCGLLLEH